MLHFIWQKKPDTSHADFITKYDDVVRIELHHADGSRMALDGRPAMMWLRGHQIGELELNKQGDYYNDRRETIFRFRPVMPDGRVWKKTLEEMLIEHEWSTAICSLPNHARETSSTYKEIIEMGWDAVPEILKFLKFGHGSMHTVLLLMDITQESPYEAAPVAPGFVGYKVDDCVQAWLDWGKRKGLL